MTKTATRFSLASVVRMALLIAVLLLSSLGFGSRLSAADLFPEGAAKLADSLSVRYSTESIPDFDSITMLDDYLAYAAIQSPALRSAFYRWLAALDKSGYAGAMPDPVLSFAYYIENVETRVGPQEQRYSLKQAFPWFGTLGTRKDIARHAANVAYRKYQSEKLKLFYRVRAAYNSYYFLGRDIALTGENLELLKFWESVVRTKYKVALSQHPDVIKAQVELGMLEDRLLTLKDKTSSAQARLRAVLNLPPTVDLPIPNEIIIEETEFDSDSIVALAIADNPDMTAIVHLIEKQRSSVALAGKKARPNFTFGVDYIQTGSALNPALDESGKDPWVVGVGINLPIWFGKNRSRRDEAEARLRMVQYDYSDARNQLTAYAENILFEHSDALRKTRLYRDGLVPKATQALNASYTAYQAGTADFLNLLDAQRQLLAFQLQLEKARADLATRRAEIDMITAVGLE